MSDKQPHKVETTSNVVGLITNVCPPKVTDPLTEKLADAVYVQLPAVFRSHLGGPEAGLYEDVFIRENFSGVYRENIPEGISEETVEKIHEYDKRFQKAVEIVVGTVAAKMLVADEGKLSMKAKVRDGVDLNFTVEKRQIEEGVSLFTCTTHHELLGAMAEAIHEVLS